ncbi:hypothetical protein PbB2_03046 [Candidatus Phycosocius bacilliformis]|uniref:Uncharacterized protein n=1 Tax=Candidatus Phycosocius bacilliformis TaxID=1445552 RepID=A0A2P2EE58_9PROT|nr:hypothetical protein PbB2_03046 [Candidatus Phycosocius bacilliformis]
MVNITRKSQIPVVYAGICRNYAVHKRKVGISIILKLSTFRSSGISTLLPITSKPRMCISPER